MPVVPVRNMYPRDAHACVSSPPSRTNAMHMPSRVSVYVFSPKHFRTGHFPEMTRENADLSDRQASATDYETPSQTLFSLPDTVRQSARAPAVLPDSDRQNQPRAPLRPRRCPSRRSRSSASSTPPVRRPSRRSGTRRTPPLRWSPPRHGRQAGRRATAWPPPGRHTSGW